MRYGLHTLAALIICLAPDEILVGWPIVSVGDHFATGMRESIARRTPPTVSSLIRLTTTEAHERYAAIGAVELPLDQFLKPA